MTTITAFGCARRTQGKLLPRNPQVPCVRYPTHGQQDRDPSLMPLRALKPPVPRSRVQTGRFRAARPGSDPVRCMPRSRAGAYWRCSQSRDGAADAGNHQPGTPDGRNEIEAMQVGPREQLLRRTRRRPPPARSAHCRDHRRRRECDPPARPRRRCRRAKATRGRRQVRRLQRQPGHTPHPVGPSSADAGSRAPGSRTCVRSTVPCRRAAVGSSA